MSINPANYPLLASVYVRPSLLEAGFTDEHLSQPLAVSDPKELEKLSGRKGKKLGKYWAPLLIHNAFSLESVAVSDRFSAALDAAEHSLKSASASPWAAAFYEAGRKSVPPTLYIKGLPKEKKQLLNAGTKQWKSAADSVENALSKWVVQDIETVKDLISESDLCEQKPGAKKASLKRLAKFSTFM